MSALHGHRLAIASVSITADGRIGLSGGYDKAARLWNLETGEVIEMLHTLNEGIVYAVALSVDGKLAVTGAGDGAIRVWDLPAGTLRATLVGHTPIGSTRLRCPPTDVLCFRARTIER